MSGTRSLLVGGLAAAALLLLAGTLLLRGPGVVAEISIVNPSEFDVQVDVSRPGGEGWTSVATVDSGSSSVARDVIDQGEIWVFRFRAQGRDGGERPMSRPDLRRAGWSFEIPAEVIDRLRQSGAPATP
jgi:hypothetical protein